jgi:aldehyde:ferredoxin oxidoreductase
MKDLLLRVNLSTKTITKEEIPEEYLRDYLGGSGLAARYLYDEIPVGGDVFDENNKLFFSVGPLNGGFFPTSGRYNVSCRSPLTGIWLDSSSSGKFGFYLRKAGYMAIIIEGKSDKPVYLYINNDDVQIRDASDLWGMTISPTVSKIKEACGTNKASVLAIGPAGEKLIKMANIVTDATRSAGRGGAGALMGSKKLKAIFLTGNKENPLPDTDSWKQLVKDFSLKVAQDPTSQAMKAYGTSVAMAMTVQSGDAPTKYFQLGSWDGYMKISGITMAQTILRKHTPECHSCPIQCARYVEIDEGPYKMAGNGPEYEAVGAYGSLVLNDNLESIAYINNLCNEYGIDTISSGSSIAWAMEAYEKGIITSADTNGLELTWGNVDAILSMLRMILDREGLGKLLGEGVRHAASVIGKGSEEFAIHVKGLEAPMHDPRAFSSFASTFATSPRGACHCHGYVGGWDGRGTMPEAGINEVQDPHGTHGKGLLAKAVQDYSAAISSSIFCLFTTYALGPSDLAQALSLATGRKYSAADVLKTGERIFNLQRAFNNRLGITSKDDCLPKRLLTSTIGGPNEGFVPNLSEQLDEYYNARKWQADGRPSPDKLMELGLDFVVKDLYG